MDDPRRKLTNLSHAYMALIWRKYNAGTPLTGEDARLARCMAAYPEWVQWWERADDVGDAEVRTPEGVNPFLTVTVEAALEEMIEHGGDEVAQHTYQQLRHRGLSHDQARAEIGRVFLGIYRLIDTGGIASEEGTQAFPAALKRLAAGESAREILDSEPDGEADFLPP